MAAIWRWFVGLFRSKPVDPSYYDHRQAVDELARTAANAASSRMIPPR